MSSFPWWRRPFGGFVVHGVSLFLAFALTVILLTIVCTVKAVLLTPVETENRQRLEQVSQEPGQEYERDLKRASEEAVK